MARTIPLDGLRHMTKERPPRSHYLRKTATYSVASASGERLFVDEFEAAEPRLGAGAAAPAARTLMLRSGAAVRALPDGSFEASDSGERFTVLARE